MLVFQGSLALGSAAWGVVAQRAGIHTALMCAGFGTIATIMLTVFARLPNAPSDLSPWNHWRAPAVVKEVESELERGPMLVTVEYVVAREQRDEFVEVMRQYGRTRRRDGASRWGIFHDTEDGDRYLEIFLVNSCAEHLRQHERQTQADRELEERLRRYLVNDPVARHLIVAQSKDRT